MLKTTLAAFAVFICLFSSAQNGMTLSNVDVSNSHFAIGIVGEEGLSYGNVLNWLEANPGVHLNSRCESQSIVRITTDQSIYKSYDVLLSELQSQFPGTQFYRKGLDIFDHECAGESLK